MKRQYPLLELRQYTLFPGQRDTLIELFEREFVTGQEAVGIRMDGQFRDEQRPDRFVWLRSFPDMAERKRALEAFYYGPVWRAHREAANATMLDSDNVLLLRALGQDGEFSTSAGAPTGTQGIFIAALPTTVLRASTFSAEFRRELEPELTASGAVPLGHYLTDPDENTFVQLPIRTDGFFFVWLAAVQAERVQALQKTVEAWQKKHHGDVEGLAEYLHLIPTAQTRLKWSEAARQDN